MPISFWGLNIGKSLVKRYWPDDAFQKRQLLNAITLGLGAMSFANRVLYRHKDYTRRHCQLLSSVAALEGVCRGSLMILFDSIKSSIQTNTSSQVFIRQAFVELTSSKEGLAALVWGWQPAVLIAFPANAACFLGMELAWQA